MHWPKEEKKFMAEKSRHKSVSCTLQKQSGEQRGNRTTGCTFLEGKSAHYKREKKNPPPQGQRDINTNARRNLGYLLWGDDAQPLNERVQGAPQKGKNFGTKKDDVGKNNRSGGEGIAGRFLHGFPGKIQDQGTETRKKGLMVGWEGVKRRGGNNLCLTGGLQ